MKTGIDRFAAKGRETSIQVRQERAKRRAAELAPIIAEVQANGATALQAIAAILNDRGIPTARGGSWSAVQVHRVLALTARDDIARLHPGIVPATAHRDKDTRPSAGVHDAAFLLRHPRRRMGSR